MMRWKKESRAVAAALTLRDGAALYAELLREDGGLSVGNADVIELPDGLVKDGHLGDGERLGAFLRKKLAFRWGRLPLALGIPSSDCIFRLFDLPAADVDEARDAMRWCFSEYFPYKYDDALFDLCEVPLPEFPGRLRLFGAACSKSRLMPLLERLKNSRCRVHAAEPQIAACVRALSGGTGAWLTAVAQGEALYLAFAQDGAVLMFRSVPLAGAGAAQIDSEIRATMNYAADKFGGGFRLQLSGELPVPDSDVPALAGAVRKEIPDFHRLDFVPPASPAWYDVAGLLLRYASED